MSALRPILLPRCVVTGFVVLALAACSDLTAPPSSTTGAAPAGAAKPAATTRIASPKAPAPSPAPSPADAPALAANQGETVAASHILVAFAGAMRADPSITRTKDEAKKRAEGFLARARKGDDFAQLAEQNSDDASAKRNKGALGRFTRSQMVTPFADAAFALKPGQVSELVETQFGYHVIKRTE